MRLEFAPKYDCINCWRRAQNVFQVLCLGENRESICITRVFRVVDNLTLRPFSLFCLDSNISLDQDGFCSEIAKPQNFTFLDNKLVNFIPLEDDFKLANVAQYKNTRHQERRLENIRGVQRFQVKAFPSYFQDPLSILPWIFPMRPGCEGRART